MPHSFAPSESIMALPDTGTGHLRHLSLVHISAALRYVRGNLSYAFWTIPRFWLFLSGHCFGSWLFSSLLFTRLGRHLIFLTGHEMPSRHTK
ncbi:hypothetical protein CC79DRAFT_884357 [Sarocladium strictum]